MASTSRTIDYDKRAEDLFVLQTIPEIKDAEKQARSTIEKKKQELREMVGERYRDLIDAADSVVAMSNSAKNVVQLVATAQGACQHIQQTHFLKGTGGRQAPPVFSPTHSLAAQMQLVTLLQEKVWVELGKSNYQSAALSYLIIQHTSSQLRLTGIKWPVPVSQLWQRTASFKPAILQACHEYLKSTHITQEHSLQSLVAIVLLENCSMSKAFSIFLNAREVAVRSLFGPSSETQSAKSVLKDFVILVQQTFLLLFYLFSSSSTVQNNIVASLKQVTSPTKGLLDDMVPSHLISRLPEHMTKFIPGYASDLVLVSPETLHTSVEGWCTRCKGVVEVGVAKMLQHISSLKALAGIRNSLHSVLSQPLKESCPEPSSLNLSSDRLVWDTVCQAILGHGFSIYEQFLRTQWLKSAKSIINNLLAEWVGEACQLLRNLLERYAGHPEEFGMDLDMTAYMWLPGEQSWKWSKGSTESMTASLEFLQMRARGCTPQLARFCRNVSDLLFPLEEDLGHLEQPEKEKQGPPQLTLLTPAVYSASEKNNDHYPFSCYGDVPLLHLHLQTSLSQSVSRFLVEVDNALDSCFHQATPSVFSTQHLDSLLLSARLCQSLAEFCPVLCQLSQGKGNLDSSCAANYSWKSHSSRPSNESKEEKPSVLLENKSHDLMRKWCRHFYHEFITKFRESLELGCSDITHLSSSVAWENIAISEEDETGKKISSTIKLPSHASVYTTAILFALSQELSRIGVHCVHSDILLELIDQIFGGILDCYLQLLCPDGSLVKKLPQDAALQLMFDVKFLSNVLHPCSREQTELSKKVAQILELISSCIDPFDLDVFSPHLVHLEEKQVQQCSVLLGILMAPRGKYLHSRPAISSSASEQHIVLPLANTLPRIPLLPSSAAKSGSSHHSLLMQDLGKQHLPVFSQVAACLQHI